MSAGKPEPEKPSKTGVYVNGVKVKDICSSPWGIGTYTVDWGDGPEPMYGFPSPIMNPHDFAPDHQCCTPEELAAWRAALTAWDEEHAR
jgi:hypothetical protein